MTRYAIWNKQDPITTPGICPVTGKQTWTAEEYISKKAPWAAASNVKAIIGAGVINGGVFLEFASTVEHYKKLGVVIEDGMTDNEILAAIEYFEDNPPIPEASAEERIAAALEFQNIMSL